MTAAQNRERGIRVEDLACDRWPARPIDDGRDDWCDLEFVDDVTEDVGGTAVVEADTLAEVKSCLAEYSSAGRTSSGRWWIRRGAHEQLLDVDGVYILAVVDPETDDVLRMALADATTVDALIDGDWWDCGDGGRTAEEFHQIAWTRVFDSLEAPGGESA